MSIDDFVSRYGFLIGSGFVGVMVFWVGSILTSAVHSFAYELRQALNAKTADSDLPGSADALRDIAETLESLHKLLGGRQWKREEVDEDLDGPTIQSLLASIAESLKAQEQ